MTSEIQAAFGRLYAAECERMSAIKDPLGVIRSKVVVGDFAPVQTMSSRPTGVAYRSQGHAQR